MAGGPGLEDFLDEEGQALARARMRLPRETASTCLAKSSSAAAIQEIRCVWLAVTMMNLPWLPPYVGQASLQLGTYRAGGIRTHTEFLPADFKSAASAVSPPPLAG